MPATFNAQVFQNQFLPAGYDEVHAVMTVSSSQASAAAASGQALVVGLAVDASGSMGFDGGHRIRNARTALVTAIEALPESAHFFVIAGADEARPVVRLQQATREHKEMAISMVKVIRAEGGTFMSHWLDAALSKFEAARAQMPGAICQCILLTDGKNDEKDSDRVDRALTRCEGQFQCDCRGVGTDFEPDQLRKIAGKLLGTVDMIREPEQMADDFRAIIEKSSGLATSDVSLQLWTPVTARVQFVKQMTPELLDLTDKARPGGNDQTKSYPTGAWGEESRDYHIAIKVSPGAVGQTMLAGRIALSYTENGAPQNIGQFRIMATWTEDESSSCVLKPDPKVASYTGQAELAAQVQEGLAARQAGDEERATRALQRAVALAEQTGHDETKRLLQKVVEVEHDGTVRLKKQVDTKDVLELDTRSTRTKRV